MTTKVQILYLEDNLQDALRLCMVLRNIMVLSETIPDQKADEIQAFLHLYGIDWIESYSDFLLELQKEGTVSSYSLFLVDMKMQEKGVQGWEMIKKIREKRTDSHFSLWVLTLYNHFEQLLQENRRIDRFFFKNEQGYERLQRALAEVIFSDAIDDSGPFLLLPYFDGMPRQIAVDQIISIEKEGRKQFLYQLDSQHGGAQKRGFATNNLFQVVLDQIQEQHITDLVQISNKVIVNILHIEGFSGKGKKYQVYLSGRGQNIPLPVAYPYLKTLKNRFGDPLPTRT